jgi:hypothetical protein
MRLTLGSGTDDKMLRVDTLAVWSQVHCRPLFDEQHCPLVPSSAPSSCGGQPNRISSAEDARQAGASAHVAKLALGDREPQTLRTRMADSPRVRGKRDSGKVSKQKHELEYLKKKFDVSGQAAAAAQRERGPNRAKVETYIKVKKKIGHY